MKKETTLLEAHIKRLEETIRNLITAKNDLEWQIDELKAIKDGLIRMLPPGKRLEKLFR